MTTYWFEIVEKADGRYSWVLVGKPQGRRRVLARGQGYASAQDVRDAIDGLRVIVPGAEIVDTTAPGPGPVPIPTTTFRHLPDVMPLPVGASAAGD